MSLKLKPGVKVHGISPEILLALQIARDIYAEEKFDLRVTSCKDGEHSPGSLHYKGDAVDLGINGIPEDRFEVLQRRISASLTDEYQVLLESAGTPNRHIHVQFKPMKP